MPIVDSKKLHRLTVALCQRMGAIEADAVLVADHLVDANLAGHDSHGVGMLPSYVQLWRRGLLQPSAHVRIVSDRGPVLVIDGQLGLGQVIAKEAMDLGVQKASSEGAAIVALRNSAHIGRIGHWSELCARHGLASMHFVNVVDHGPIVALYGASEPVLGTNPFSAAMPGPDGAAVLLDMATSKIALGKARVAFNRGLPVPPGSLIDGEGSPTSDPSCMFPERRGALTAMGDHKGSGLALICELFAGALTGGMTLQPKNPRKGGVINNMLSVIIDPGALGDAGACMAETAAMLDYAKTMRPSPGVDEVLLPGEPERRNRAERLVAGVDIDERSWQEILAAATAVGMNEAEIDRVLA